MFHQITLDHALHRAAIAERRAAIRAMHRAPKTARRRDARRRDLRPTPAICCA